MKSSTTVRSPHGRSSWLRPGSGRVNPIGYAPILETETGVLAGVAATPLRGQCLDARQLAAAMGTRNRMPLHTFLMVRLEYSALADAAIRAELLRPSDLRGVVFDLLHVAPGTIQPGLSAVAASIQEAGGLIALQADEIWHPDFAAVTPRAPRMVVIGPKWIGQLAGSERQRALVETLGSVAAERDAWVLASGVSTLEELTTLAALHVPLVTGPAVGSTNFTDWPAPAPAAVAAVAQGARATLSGCRD